MKRTVLVVALAILALGLIVGAGCRVGHVRGAFVVPIGVEVGPPIVIAQGPPAPVYEVVPVAPSGLYIWIGGYWHWDRSRYVWMKGRYERPPHPHAQWVPPHYVRGKRDWQYQPGRWATPKAVKPTPTPPGRPTPAPPPGRPTPPPRGHGR